jgi:hypothetical protein
MIVFTGLLGTASDNALHFTVLRTQALVPTVMCHCRYLVADSNFDSRGHPSTISVWTAQKTPLPISTAFFYLNINSLLRCCWLTPTELLVAYFAAAARQQVCMPHCITRGHAYRQVLAPALFFLCERSQSRLQPRRTLQRATHNGSVVGAITAVNLPDGVNNDGNMSQ